eukprot:TRINITY_DN14391_c0_g1_i1.p1 TRINITY_DN14391_c0_g1~~TRINITY_DN14391_c0_g1_i1.p1  ORF type:complete len:688 (+),score=133.07 TRINITY_DN14391_c0_g1_i1:323-2386(+)
MPVEFKEEPPGEPLPADLCQRLREFASSTFKRELGKVGDKVENLLREEYKRLHVGSDGIEAVPVAKRVQVKPDVAEIVPACLAERHTFQEAPIWKSEDSERLSIPKKNMRKSFRNEQALLDANVALPKVRHTIRKGVLPAHAVASTAVSREDNAYLPLSTVDDEVAVEAAVARPEGPFSLLGFAPIASVRSVEQQRIMVGHLECSRRSDCEDIMARHPHITKEVWQRHESLQNLNGETAESLTLSEDLAASRDTDRHASSRLALGERFMMVLEDITTSTAMSCIVSLAVVVNAASIGVDTQLNAIEWKVQANPVCVRVNTTCCVIFAVDVALRMMVFGRAMLTEPDWAWNVFDVVMVVSQVVEEVRDAPLSPYARRDGTGLGYDEKEGGPSIRNIMGIARLMRVFRLFRLLRTARFLSFTRDLRMIVFSLQNSSKSLLSAMLLLAMMAYCMGVYITQLVTQFKLSPEATQAQIGMLQPLFGTLDKSMLTLYQAISSGVDWRSVEEPLSSSISPWLTLLLCVYVAFALMAMLNVITSIFISTAIRHAERDQQQVMVRAMRNLFNTCDVDGSGTISWDEFQTAVDSEESEPFFREIDMSPDEALKLFKLLDVDESGELSADELIHGCLRLQGQTKAIDFAAFLHDFWKWTYRFDQLNNTLQMVAAPELGISIATQEMSGPRLQPPPRFG